MNHVSGHCGLLTYDTSSRPGLLGCLHLPSPGLSLRRGTRGSLPPTRTHTPPRASLLGDGFCCCCCSFKLFPRNQFPGVKLMGQRMKKNLRSQQEPRAVWVCLLYCALPPSSLCCYFFFYFAVFKLHTRTNVPCVCLLLTSVWATLHLFTYWAIHFLINQNEQALPKT